MTMKSLLRLEELAQFLFVLGVIIMWQQRLDLPWWIYLLLVLGPDISMLGYLVNPRVGRSPTTCSTTRVSH